MDANYIERHQILGSKVAVAADAIPPPHQPGGGPNSVAMHTMAQGSDAAGVSWGKAALVALILWAIFSEVNTQGRPK